MEHGQLQRLRALLDKQPQIIIRDEKRRAVYIPPELEQELIALLKSEIKENYSWKSNTN